MQPIYRKDFTLRTNDCDRRGQILPSAVLDIFQTVAGQHAEILGCGFKNLLKKDLLWVLVKVKYRVLRQPESYEALTVTTWPLPPSKITLQREYLISDRQGEPLIIGSSQWTTLNKTTRKLSPTKDVYNLSDKDFCATQNFEGRFARVPAFEAESDGMPILPGYCDIDQNGHVNNTKYANFILNAFPPEENAPLKELQIDYHKELLSGDEVSLFESSTEDFRLFSGKNSLGETMFSAKFEY